MKKIIVWALLLSICFSSFTGCSEKSKNDKGKGSEKSTEAPYMLTYLQKDPFESEEEFWEYVESTFPVTSYQDVINRKMEMKDTLLEGIVGYCNSVSPHEKELLIYFPRGYGDYYIPCVEKIDFDRSNFHYGETDVRNCEKDDVIRIFCNPLKCNGLYMDGIMGIKKVDHQDGVVDDIIKEKEKAEENTVDSMETTEKTEAEDNKTLISNQVREHITQNYTYTD